MAELLQIGRDLEAQRFEVISEGLSLCFEKRHADDPLRLEVHFSLGALCHVHRDRTLEGS